jgi:hypothetical protein
VWAGVAGIGVALGPLGGGFLLEHFWWGSVFLVNVPICAAALVLGHFFVPDSKDPEEGRLDLLGSALSIVALFGLLYALIQGPDNGWTSPQVLTGFGAAVVFFTLFGRWELRAPYPMLDLRFFRNPRFTAASATITLTYFSLFGSTFLLTQYFQFVLGYSPLKAGVMSSVPLGMTIRLMFGFGMGMTTAPATESIMGSLPRGKAGVGSAVNDTTRQTGGALGVALLGSIFAAHYHALTASSMRGVPAAAADAARDSIGKAVRVGDSLPAPLADIVRHDSVHAYLASMRLVYPIAAGVVVVAIGITLRFLPARELGGGPPEPPATSQQDRQGASPVDEVAV